MIPWFKYTIVQIGPFPLQVWGFFVAMGMLLTIYIIWKTAKKKSLDADLLVDMAIWVLIGGFVGARIFHVFLYEPSFYLNNPSEIIAIWHGGLSSFGGIFGAFAAFLFFAKKKKIDKSKWFKIADITTYAALYGWIVGRIGCVMIHDHIGKPCNCFLAIQTPEGVPRLEMALLEIIFLLPLAVYLYITRTKKRPDGWYLYLLFIYYGVLRFVLDFFRAVDTPSADVRYVGLTPAQYFSILLVFLGISYFFKARKKI